MAWILCSLLCVLQLCARISTGFPFARELEVHAQKYTNSWAIEVLGGPEKADEIAQKYGFENRGQVGILRNVYHFVLPEHTYTSNSRGKSLGEPLYHISHAMEQEEEVMFVEQQQLHRRVVKKGYSPPTDPIWNNQWYLLNTGQVLGSTPGRDLHVEPVWIQGITGCNSVVAIVDDGVEYTHPDIMPNYLGSIQYDYVSNDGDPFPEVTEDGERESHGTSCTGEITMVKDNDVCGVGVAYQSSVTGIRLISDVGPGVTDMQEANSLGHQNNIVDIYSNSWGPSDVGFIVERPGTLLQRTLETGVREGRNGKGSIYVWAAGNGGEYGDSCAADGYASSIYTIAIGAASINGFPASYDEECPGKMAVTFVDNPLSQLQVATTSTNSRCTDSFDGTSSACPLVSGTIALVFEANPTLTWRDVQYLIAYTSNSEILTQGSFITNGAGLRVSHNFGFGAIDAEAMVTRARHWISVPEQQSDTVTPTPNSGQLDPLTSDVFTISYNGEIGFLEHVIVTVTLRFEGIDPVEYADYQYYYDDNFPDRGEIRIEMTSPSETISVLLPYRRDDILPNEYNEWPFMSVHFWGEDPAGNWSVTIINNNGQGPSLLISDFSATFYGTTDTPEAVQRIPSQCDSACTRGCAAPGPEFCDVCANIRNATTLECIDECPQGFVSRSGNCYDPTLPEPECVRNIEPSPGSAISLLASTYSIVAITCGIVAYVIYS